MDVIDGIIHAAIIGMLVGGALWAYSIKCGVHFGWGFLTWIGLIIVSILGGILLLVPAAVIWFYILHKNKEKRKSEEKQDGR